MGRDMVVLRYAIPTGILCVDGLSTGPSGFGVSQLSAPLFVWILLEANQGRGLLRSRLHHPLGSVYTDVRYKSPTPPCL